MAISLNESYTSIVNCIAENLLFIVAVLMSVYEVDQDV
jgi:hypothetical protein